MGLWQKRYAARRLVAALLLLVALLFSTGCFTEGPKAAVRLEAGAADSLNIGVDADGWYVSVEGTEKSHVTEQIIVEATASKMLIVWHNDDDRYHEIMFHRDHSDHDSVHMDPGERVERWIDLDFERYIHSHHAAELPELHVRIEQSQDR